MPISLNFAVMNVGMKRRIAAWLLLAVYVPMLILASLHVHSESDAVSAITCDECVQHQCHGHLVQMSVLSHVCVLCQFLTIPLVAVATLFILLYNNVQKTASCEQLSGFISARSGIVGLRAPPAFLL